MPSHIKSPYATSFNSAIKRGVPAGVAVAAIAKRQNKSQQTIFNSLYRAEICERQKINGQYVYWPANQIRTNATQAKVSQIQLWQNLVDWSIASGNVRPQQLTQHVGSQQEFMSYCRTYFGRQLSGTTTTASATSRRTKTTRRSSSSYAFPNAIARTTQRRYRRAA